MLTRKLASMNHIKSLCRFSLLAALALTCTGCHYDSNPDIDDFRETSLQEDMDVIFDGIPRFLAPLTLEEIYELASSRNLNILVKQLEYEIQTELVTRERFGMLPDIKSHFESLIRNRNTASSSESLVPGVPPAPLSISSQKHQWRWDYALVWNYVDFGLSFLRSRQEHNRAMKVQFEYQRIQQNLLVDITREYWKAQTAKLARKKSKIILEKAKVQQAAIQKQLEAKIISEIQGLRSEGQLLTYQSQFQFYDKEYHTALSELALLMGLPPCVEFEIADVVAFEVDACLDDICELESLALYNRPELFSDDAEELIQRDEARAAVLQMYPGVDLFTGHNHDSNRFLLFNHWIQAGTRAAYNLLDWPRHLQESRAAEGRILLAKNNRLLMSVSVMTQVHLAYSVYLDNLESYKLAKSIEDISTRLLRAAQSEQRQGKLHDADVLKYEIDLLEGQISSLKQYGEVQNSLEQLNNAMGLPLYYVNSRAYGVLEDTPPLPATKPLEEDEEEDAASDAEELRDIYLDYIIEKIEREEEAIQHSKDKGADDGLEPSNDEDADASDDDEDSDASDDDENMDEDTYPETSEDESDDQKGSVTDTEKPVSDDPVESDEPEAPLPSTGVPQGVAARTLKGNATNHPFSNFSEEDEDFVVLDDLLIKYGIPPTETKYMQVGSNDSILQGHKDT